MSDQAIVPKELLREACARHGIRPKDEFLVMNRLLKSQGVQACCGSDCQPCILDVEAAESEIRQKLGIVVE